MSALFGMLLLLGGLAAALVGLFAMSAEGAGQAVVVFVGLVAVIVGAVALLVIRMSGTEGRPPAPPAPLRGLTSPTAVAPFAARMDAPKRARRRARAAATSMPGARGLPGSSQPGRPAWLAEAPSASSILRSRRLGSTLTWAILGAIYFLSGTAGSGSWLEFMAGLVIVATPVGIVAAIASRVLTGRAWGWAVSVAVAGVAFVAGIVVGAFIEPVLGG